MSELQKQNPIPPVAEAGKPQSQHAETSGRMIVVGWLITHRFSHEDTEALTQARVRILEILQQ
jgi:hypothetical protein